MTLREHRQLSSLCRHFAWSKISSMGSWQMTNELGDLRGRAWEIGSDQSAS